VAPTRAAALERAIPPHALLAAEAAEEKSGIDTVVLDMSDSLGVVDAFVITSGRNTRQVKTIVEEVERRVAEPGHGWEASGNGAGSGSAPERRRPTSVEGLDDATWVLMDYGDFVVHVFLEEARQYYDLEHLWSRAPRVGPAPG
jgi:ribosome-associated protein